MDRANLPAVLESASALLCNIALLKGEQQICSVHVGLLEALLCCTIHTQYL